MFYDQLLKACQIKGVKLTPLLKTLKISPGNTSSWKKGGYPSVELLNTLATTLEVSVDFLLEKTNDPIPSEYKNSQQDISDEDLKFALWGTTDINDAVLDDVRRFAKFAMEDEAKKLRGKDDEDPKRRL